MLRIVWFVRTKCNFRLIIPHNISQKAEVEPLQRNHV